MAHFAPPLPEPRVRRSPAMQKKTLRQTLACAGVGTLCRYFLAGPNCETGHPSPISKRSATRRQETIQLHTDRQDLSITIFYGLRRV